MKKTKIITAKEAIKLVARVEEKERLKNERFWNKFSRKINRAIIRGAKKGHNYMSVRVSDTNKSYSEIFEELKNVLEPLGYILKSVRETAFADKYVYEVVWPVTEGE